MQAICTRSRIWAWRPGSSSRVIDSCRSELTGDGRQEVVRNFLKNLKYILRELLFHDWAGTNRRECIAPHQALDSLTVACFGLVLQGRRYTAHNTLLYHNTQDLWAAA
ncbi:hypothetical protein MHYP_G00196570 [Metynnis hypsauchen]